MKVKITMEADVTNLPAFNEDVSVLEIRGAGRENVWDIFNHLRIHNCEKKISCLLDHPINQDQEKIRNACMLAIEDERKLIDMLIDGIKIEYSEGV